MASLKLGLVVLSCNSVGGGHGLVSLLEGWFWSRTMPDSEKEASSWELTPTASPACLHCIWQEYVPVRRDSCWHQDYTLGFSLEENGCYQWVWPWCHAHASSCPSDQAVGEQSTFIKRSFKPRTG
jgi:hypothetical protein